jgi:2Fe-2S ferredoxin
MVRVTFICPDGAEHCHPVAAGASLMEAAVRNNVPGIDADCGGACSCGTCHVYIDQRWSAHVGPAAGAEAAMLDFSEHARPASRSACQIPITTALDGLVVVVAPR